MDAIIIARPMRSRWEVAYRPTKNGNDTLLASFTAGPLQLQMLVAAARCAANAKMCFIEIEVNDEASKEKILKYFTEAEIENERGKPG